MTDVKPEISIDDFAKLDLRVGEIIAAERVDKSKKLIKLQVSFGDFQRQIVARIGELDANGLGITPASLINMRYLFVVNLPPKTFKDGTVSHGMILATKAEIGFAMFIPSRIDVAPGASAS